MDEFCCKMRERFRVGIVLLNPAVPDPPETVDFLDWDAKTETGKAIIRIKFCPFCGKAIPPPTRVQAPIVELIEKEELVTGLNCKKCGNPIKAGFCSNKTCPFSTHEQDSNFLDDE